MDEIELGTQFEFSYAPGTSQQQMLGFEMAGQIWSQYLKDDVAIQLYVEMTNELPENVIGGALPGMKKDIKYEKLWQEMSEDITSINDLTAFNNLSSFDKKYTALVDGQRLDKVEKMKLTNANAKALDLLDGDRDKLDGYIVMNDLTGQSNVQWDYDTLRNNNLNSNSLDFLSVALHEVGHVLGFVSGLDDGDWLNVVTEAREKNEDIEGKKMEFATPLDLFRYSADSAAYGQVDLSIGQEAFFSIDGGNSNLGYFSTGEYSDLGGDGYQASHWKNGGDSAIGIMDPALKTGQIRDISTLDITAMDVMGWDVVAPVGLNWSELYNNAVIEAENAHIEDRTKDVEKMVKESKTYHGRRSSNGSSDGGSWQVGLWQHIKFQTLDLSSVDADTEYKVYVNSALVTDSLTNIEINISVVENYNQNLNNIEDQHLRHVDLTEDLTTSQFVVSVNTLKESESFDLSESDQLIEGVVEIVDSLNDDLVININ